LGWHDSTKDIPADKLEEAPSRRLKNFFGQQTARANAGTDGGAKLVFALERLRPQSNPFSDSMFAMRAEPFEGEDKLSPYIGLPFAYQFLPKNCQ